MDVDDGPTTPRVRRACLLTGGGDAPGLNAVVRGFVKRASQLGIEVLGSVDGFEGLLEEAPSTLAPIAPRDCAPGAGDRLRLLDPPAVRGILHRGGSILGCSNKANPFVFPVKKGSRETYDASAKVVERVKEHGIDCLVLVGGDGTMHFARRFIAMGVPCIGVPKTIDNDLGLTDQTFGFETAVNTATWAIDTLHSTAEAHARVHILEVMGRYAGWIALCSGIAGGADVILIPEIPYDVSRVAAKVCAREKIGLKFSIIVVSEGARPIGGDYATAEKIARPGQLVRLGGAAERLMRELEGRVDHEIRSTVLGHLQRGGSPSAYDRVLGTRMGVHAAELCARAAFGKLVVLEGTTIRSVPLESVPDSPRLVDPNGQLCNTARALGVELGAP